MAASSTMLELGTPLPAFSLPDATSGKPVSSDTLRGSIAVVAFICNHCPYVKYIQSALATFARDYAAKGVKLVGISSNDAVRYPDDAPERMAEEAQRAGYAFPYLFDDEQEVARTFRAACTPEFYVFDAQSKLAYRGRFDEATPNSGVKPTGKELRAAVEALLAGQAPSPNQVPSIGCGIKWKSGNAPDYA
jgi:peroxiredoxin